MRTSLNNAWRAASIIGASSGVELSETNGGDDVEDLAAYRKRITDAGGKILVEEQQVPGMGAFSLFADPEGRVLGMWKQTGR